MPDPTRIDHSLARMQLDSVLLAINLLDEGLMTGERNDHLVACRKLRPTPTRVPRCGRARGSLDRHATYIVAAYLAGAAR